MLPFFQRTALKSYVNSSRNNSWSINEHQQKNKTHLLEVLLPVYNEKSNLPPFAASCISSSLLGIYVFFYCLTTIQGLTKPNIR